jgi:hypothetical protein
MIACAATGGSIGWYKEKIRGWENWWGLGFGSVELMRQKEKLQRAEWNK